MLSQKEHNQMAPPKWPLKILRLFIREIYLEEIEGDMEERFQENLKYFTAKKARRIYLWDTFKLLNPVLLKNLTGNYQLNQYDMFKHNLILAFRNFKRYKTAFLINVLGLSSGLACVLLINLWVSDELSVDTYYENDGQLYQVLKNRTEDQITTSVHTPGILANALQEEIPEIKFATSVVPAEWFDSKGVLTFNNIHLKADGQYIDQNYFNVFPTEFLFGKPIESLPNKSSIVISEVLAEKLFNQASEAIGKTVTWNQGASSQPYQIIGIYKAPPTNASVQFDLMINIDVFLEKRKWLTNWRNSDPSTYAMIKEGIDINQLNSKISPFIQSKDTTVTASLFLQKYSDRYLNGVYQNGIPAGGRIEYVRLYSVVAVFILFIACINFITLSTAQATRRLKEVGVKKAIGAGRKQLIYQYLGESMLLTTISFILAFLLVLLILPVFNHIMDKELFVTYDLNSIAATMGILGLTGLLSGIYPAIYISGFHPLKALKKQGESLSSSISEVFIRKGLVIFQFSISVLLILSVIVIYHQMDFIQSKNLGYNRDNIAYFTLPDEVYDKTEEEFEKYMITYQNEVNSIPGILHATNISHNLTGDHGEFWGLDWKAGNEDESIHFRNLEIGYDFMKTFGIEVLEGRTFSRDFGNEHSNILINEQAAAIMGLENPVGKSITLWGEERRIIGVAQDFHFESLYDQLKPCIMQLATSESIAVKIKAGTEKESLTQLEDVFMERFPGYSFDYRFVDQDYQQLYDTEQRASFLSKCFAGIAIIITCLGLFGLASFTVERRTKEIGIRKVLGATMIDIIYLLSLEFNTLVLIAFGIAAPLSFVFASNWLNKFAYRIDLNGWWILSVGITLMLITWFVIGWQTIKAALSNPVDCLRDE